MQQTIIDTTTNTNINSVNAQPTHQLSVQQTSFFLSINMLFIIIMFVFVVLYLRVKYVRKRIRKLKTQMSKIDSHKIIIAVQIQDFIVKYSTKCQQGYFDLGCLYPQIWIWNIMDRMFGWGYYYKPLFQHQKIRQFIAQIDSIQKAQLFLYTNLPCQAADKILQRLKITKYFPNSKRRYCDLKNRDDSKHAIQVDQQTGRVMIITPNRSDHRPQFSKYFLVVKPDVDNSSFLRDFAKKLKTFINEIEDPNQLHEKLAELQVYDEDQSSFSESDLA